MAKRKTEEMIKELKKRKTGEEEKLSDIAHDPRTATWPTTSFPGGKARLYSWNVNGLKACMGRGDLQKFLKEEDPDVLCLNETKMDEKKIEAEKVRKNLFEEKYLQYWNCCKSSSGYAGTAVLTKVKPLSVKFDLGIIEHDLEGRTITLEFPDFVLVACYVPNAGQKLDRLVYRTKQWDLDFRKYLKNMEQSKNKCVILCGDLNVAHEEIDIWNASGNKRSAGFTIEERTEFTNFLKLGFADSFRKLHPTTVKYSYWNLRSNARAENKGWRLDYFVVSDALLGAVTDSDMLTKVTGSDHCPLKLFLDVSKVKKPGAAQGWKAEEAKAKGKGDGNGKESESEESDSEKSEDENEKKVKKQTSKKETLKSAKQTRLKTKATIKKGGNP